MIGVLVPYTSPAPDITFYLHSAMAIYPIVAMILVYHKIDYAGNYHFSYPFYFLDQAF